MEKPWKNGGQKLETRVRQCTTLDDSQVGDMEDGEEESVQVKENGEEAETIENEVCNKRTEEQGTHLDN